MKNDTQIRVASLLMMFVGLWVASLPLFLTIEGSAVAGTLISGIALSITGLVQVFTRSALPSVMGIVASLWIGVSPLLYSVGDAFTYNMLIAGAVGFIASLWDSVEISSTYGTTVAR